MRRGCVLMISLVLVWVLVAVWALTESEPEEGRGSYGNVMTLQNQGAAEVFGVDEPGVYIVNKNNKPVSAVRGGLGMILRGLGTADLTQAKVGWRGVKAGLSSTGSGFMLTAVFAVSVLGLLAVVAMSVRDRKRKGDSDHGDHQQ